MNKKQMMKGHWTVNYDGTQSLMALKTFICSKDVGSSIIRF